MAWITNLLVTVLFPTLSAQRSSADQPRPALLLFLAFATLLSGCYRYHRLGEPATLSNPPPCSDLVKVKPKSPEGLYLKASCLLTSPLPHERSSGCALLRRASACGVHKAQTALSTNVECGGPVHARLTVLSTVDQVETTTFDALGHGCLEKDCSVATERTTLGTILRPLGIVVGVPVAVVLGAVACVFPVQGCPLVDMFDSTPPYCLVDREKNDN